MSMGFLMETSGAAVWRGLMVMSAIDRLTRQVAWAPLDWLIVDTPPGTGDTHLSLAQTLPVAGALLVTGPGSAAYQVTRRGANMFKKLGVPLAGLVANMSTIDCPKCGHTTDLASTSSEKLAEELGEITWLIFVKAAVN
jgi:ATP-binding protein involved in chromosome partitioning